MRYIRTLLRIKPVAAAIVVTVAMLVVGTFVFTKHTIGQSTDAGTVTAIPTVQITKALAYPAVPSITPLQSVAVSASAPAAATTTVNQCSQNGSGKLLLVSIGQQHLWACDGTRLANQSAVTTGTTAIVNGVDDATPTGTWSIYSKQTNQVLRGCDANGCWNDPVQYWMPFDGEIGFHDASWQTFPFGASNYQTDGSHGCVHLPTAFAAWVYGWAPIGTTVTIEN